MKKYPSRVSTIFAALFLLAVIGVVILGYLIPATWQVSTAARRSGTPAWTIRPMTEIDKVIGIHGG